jgi:hypothetical protein
MFMTNSNDKSGELSGWERRRRWSPEKQAMITGYERIGMPMIVAMRLFRSFSQAETGYCLSQATSRYCCWRDMLSMYRSNI